MMIYNQNKVDRYHKILSYSAAPTLRRVKPSSLICLPQELNADNIRLAAEGLEMMYMYKCKSSHVIFIFNREMLDDIINKKEIKSFLTRYSYPTDCGLDIHLQHLKKRLNEYVQGENVFPHEVGIFLGYPYEDVRDFIQSKKDCCFSGYWKVFNNPQEALKIMQNYSLAQKQVLYAHDNGKRFFEFLGI
ncbi:MAG TPA: DUF3793 family protein [Clostridia bacterium]